MEADELRTSLGWVEIVWNMDGDENDMEGAWFMAGKAMKPDGLTAISAMHSAVASGRKSARGTP